MKVIVKTSGFYGGSYFEASKKQVEIAPAVARPFMAPYGDSLEAVAAQGGGAKAEPKAKDQKDN